MKKTILSLAIALVLLNLWAVPTAQQSIINTSDHHGVGN